MGREARCTCRWAGVRGEVTALLEADVLILRGTVSRRVPRSDLADLQVVADELCFVVGGEEVALGLGPIRAHHWQEVLSKPPPTLAEKLGITHETSLRVHGKVADAQLRQALSAAGVAWRPHTAMTVAVVGRLSELESALQDHEELLAGRPIWVVHGKGGQAEPGATAVRELMRGRGYRDSKVAAISEVQSATRYARR